MPKNLPSYEVQQEIKTSIGSGTDVASPTGSLHAKLKDMEDKGVRIIEPVYQPFQNFSTFSGNPGAIETILEIAGSGYLSKASARLSGTGSTVTLKITIDGVVYAVFANAGTKYFAGIMPPEDILLTSTTASNVPALYARVNNYMELSSTFSLIDGGAFPSAEPKPASILLTEYPIPFKESLKIEIEVAYAVGTAAMDVQGKVRV